MRGETQAREKKNAKKHVPVKATNNKRKGADDPSSSSSAAVKKPRTIQRFTLHHSLDETMLYYIANWLDQRDWAIVQRLQRSASIRWTSLIQQHATMNSVTRKWPRHLSVPLYFDPIDIGVTSQGREYHQVPDGSAKEFM